MVCATSHFVPEQVSHCQMKLIQVSGIVSGLLRLICGCGGLFLTSSHSFRELLVFIWAGSFQVSVMSDFKNVLHSCNMSEFIKHTTMKMNNIVNSAFQLSISPKYIVVLLKFFVLKRLRSFFKKSVFLCWNQFTFILVFSTASPHPEWKPYSPAVQSFYSGRLIAAPSSAVCPIQDVSLAQGWCHLSPLLQRWALGQKPGRKEEREKGGQLESQLEQDRQTSRGVLKGRQTRSMQCRFMVQSVCLRLGALLVAVVVVGDWASCPSLLLRKRSCIMGSIRSTDFHSGMSSLCV